MKRFLSGFFQFLLYLLVFLVGSVAPAFGVMHSLEWTLHPGRVFVYNGLLLMFGVYVLFLLIGLLRKRMRIAWPISTAAFVLALVLGLVSKFGFKGA